MSDSPILVSIIDAKLFRGASGSAATTLVTTCDDVSYKLTPEMKEANDRGTPFKGYVRTLVDMEFVISFPAGSNDSHLAAFVSAAITGVPISIYISDGTGSVGPEMDALVSMDTDQPLADKIGKKFTCKRASRTGRYPSFH